MKTDTLIEFHSPSQLRAYEPPAETMLAGDFHIMRGAPFVIGGAPGVGKSRAAVALAVAGATGGDWLGLRIHRRFRTMIAQAENGRLRLKHEFADLDCATLDEWVRICSPPPFGLAFDTEEFRDNLSAAIAEFAPDVFVIDPWNAVARDDKASDYLATFERIRRVVPAGDGSPALCIVAHTRKPRIDERASGRGLLATLAGSYVLASVPRAAFVMQAASDDPEDERIVWTCAKNNDGALGSRSAWMRGNGLFLPVRDFDWDSFDGKCSAARVSVGEEHMAAVFEHGRKRFAKADAARKLQDLTGASRASCYNAFKVDGRFAARLSEAEDGTLSWQ